MNKNSPDRKLRLVRLRIAEIRHVHVFAMSTVVVVTLSVLLSLRAALGPFNTPLGLVNSPIGIATIAGYCLAMVIALRLLESHRTEVDSNSRSWLIGLALSSVGVYLGLFLCASGDAFLSDDYVLVLRAATEGDSVNTIWSTAGGDGSFRPVGAYYFHWVSSIAHFCPRLWRVASLIVHLSNAALLYGICRRLWPSQLPFALSAFALFLLHGTRPEVVYWTAGSFDLLACLFSLLTIYWWLLSVMWHPLCRWSGSVFLLSLAILSKESAYVTPLLGLLLLLASERSAGKRSRSFVIVSIGTVSVFLTHRLLLFGGPGGYVDATSGSPQILSLNPSSTFKALAARLWEVLFLPINWNSERSLIVGGALFLYILSLLFVGGRVSHVSKRSLVYLTLGVIAAILPAIHLALVGETLLGSRVMYLPSVLFAILVAAFLPTKSNFAKLCLAGILVGQGVFLSNNLSAWRRASELADSICNEKWSRPGTFQSIPSEYGGAFVFANGLPECVEMKKSLADSSRNP